MVVLGCDGSYPAPGGATSGYLLRAGGATIWLDAGTGTFARLQQFVDPSSIDAVILSHEHPDHWSDLESFAVWALVGLTPPDAAPVPAPVPVYAPPGLRARSYFADTPSFRSLIDWREVDEGDQVVVGGLACRFARTDHGPPTLAVAVTVEDRVPGGGGGDDAAGGDGAAGGPAFVYGADTGPEWSPEVFGSGPGLFLCEATYTREHEGAHQHLSGRQSGAMAAAAGVGELVVTHRWPTVSAEAVLGEAAEAFGRSVRAAEAGAVFTW